VCEGLGGGRAAASREHGLPAGVSSEDKRVTRGREQTHLVAVILSSRGSMALARHVYLYIYTLYNVQNVPQR